MVAAAGQEKQKAIVNELVKDIKPENGLGMQTQEMVRLTPKQRLVVQHGEVVIVGRASASAPSTHG
ncbi:MAG: hypothetical protein IT488_07480 [Gammaproteobacteria bacterium]|nr:hypothetical protein [Gammaproteobacteria bacterium]